MSESEMRVFIHLVMASLVQDKRKKSENGGRQLMTPSYGGIYSLPAIQAEFDNKGSGYILKEALK